MIELPDWLQSKIQPEPNTGCWLWTAALNAGGYGEVNLPGTYSIGRAHRVVYQFYTGVVLGKTHLDHKCRVRCCVNPEHLEPVTSRENTLRGEGPAAINALKSICCNGHSLADAYVARRSDGGTRRICRQCRNKHQRNWRSAIRGNTTP